MRLGISIRPKIILGKETEIVSKIITGVLAAFLVGGLSMFAGTATAEECCPKDDQTPPLELIEKTPIGGLHNPYNDDVEAIEEAGHKKYLSFGCNGCHGGGGGGGMCPPLTNDTWVYGADDDTLFRLVALGSDELQKQGYTRVRKEIVTGPMPPFGTIIKTSDDMWKMIAWMRVKNPSSMKLVDKPAQTPGE